MNISTILDMAGEAFGDRIGVVNGDQRWNYADLRAAARRRPHRINGQRRAAVAMLDVTSPAAPVAIFGAAYAGVPYVPLNYRLTPPEINELIARIAPARYMIVGEQYRSLVAPRKTCS